MGKVYTPHGVRMWLNGRHRLLDNQRPIDLIKNGEADRVYAVVMQLVESAYA